jgi:LysM repeat protein
MLKMRILVLLVLLLSVMSSAHAQDNLLPNGGLEEDSFGQYTGRRSGDFPIYLPGGWSYWFAAQNGERYNRGDRTAIRPHPGPGPSVKEGRRALNIDCGFFTCTTAIFSQVNNIIVGTNLQLSAFAQVKACDLQKNAQGQIIADNCGSAIESGAQTRVGIDPNGGTDPNDIDVVWSAFIAPHEQGGWQQMSTSVTATGTTITVFLYSTQSSFADINKTYWDEVRLVTGGTGGANPAAATAVPTAPPFVAFVVPQGAQADGSIIHTVQTGDTVDSIAYAYGVSRQTILDLNGIRDGRIITVGQRLIVKPPESSGSSSISAGGPPSEATTEVAAEVGAPDTTVEPLPSEPTNEPPAVAVSPAPTEQPQEPAPAEPSATPLTPVPTQVLPTAPVVVADAGSIDPASTNGTVCVTFFDDADQNRLQEQGEALLAGGTISLLQGANAAGSYQTDGVSEPHCFESLGAGDYVAAAVAPDGFGLTTPDQLRLRLNPGSTINITFGAAQGVQPLLPPPADANPVVEEVTQQAQPQRTLADQLMSVSGLIVFGLAAVVLVGGVGLAFLLRRR